MNYQCRCTERTKKWVDIEAHSPEDAAEGYAEFARLQHPQEVTIKNEGRFRIYETITYRAVRVQT